MSDARTGLRLIGRRRGEQAIYSVRIPRVRERIYARAAGRRIITAWPPTKRLNVLRRVATGA